MLIPLAKPDKPDAFISDMLLRAIKHFDISYIPFHLPQTGSRGAPLKKPLFNSWASLGLQDTQAPRPLPPPSDAPSFSESAASIALSNVLAQDANAKWSMHPLHIKNISSIVNKTFLPEDYATPSLSKASYVNKTFDWVKQHYESRNPLHHLAFLVSLTVACFRPYLFLPTDMPIRELLSDANSKDKVCKVYNSLPWVNRRKDDGGKGLTDETIIVSMFTTFIIAIYEPKSPLRLYMKSTSRGGLGEPWTSKYCRILPISPFS
jgi:hypothetical protein